MSDGPPVGLSCRWVRYIPAERRYERIEHVAAQSNYRVCMCKAKRWDGEKWVDNVSPGG